MYQNEEMYQNEKIIEIVSYLRLDDQFFSRSFYFYGILGHGDRIGGFVKLCHLGGGWRQRRTGLELPKSGLEWHEMGQ